MDISCPERMNLPHAKDLRLAQQAHARHPSAWMELVRSSQPMVMGLLVRHVHRQEQEDLFQEVFLRVHRFLGTYRGEAALSTWIYQVTMNVIRSHWETLRRRSTQEVLATDWQAPEEDGEERAWDIPVQANQDQDLADAEHQGRLRKVQAGIATLRPLDRQMLFLREVDGCAYEAIAERLRVPMGTVKSRLARARANLAASVSAAERSAL